jgi:hypothetical protein
MAGKSRFVAVGCRCLGVGGRYVNDRRYIRMFFYVMGFDIGPGPAGHLIG